MSQVKEQEEESADLRLSELYAWQNALKVPVAELLVEPTDATSPTLLRKMQLIRAVMSHTAGG